jgi:hypothetical protein
MEDICYTRTWVQQLCHTEEAITLWGEHHKVNSTQLLFMGCDTISIFTGTKISEDPTPSIFSPHNTQQGGVVQEFQNTLSYNLC